MQFVYVYVNMLCIPSFITENSAITQLRMASVEHGPGDRIKDKAIMPRGSS